MRHRHRRRRSWVVAVCLASAALVSCAGAEPPVAEVVDRADCLSAGLGYFGAAAADPARATGPDAPSRGVPPEGFAPVRAVLCSWRPDETDGQIGERLYAGELQQLVAVLSVADRATVRAADCPPSGVVSDELWLVAESGEAVLARWPLDRCLEPVEEVSSALSSLSLLDERTLAAG